MKEHSLLLREVAKRLIYCRLMAHLEYMIMREEERSEMS